MDQRRRAGAFITVIGQQLREDPRYKTYEERLGGLTNFASAYDVALQIAEQKRHDDVLRALIKYPKKVDIGSNSQFLLT